jgi:hypothetical protein
LLKSWPKLSDPGAFYTHDTAFISVVNSLFDRTLWTEKLKDFPNPLFGAGTGLSAFSPHLGLMIKGNQSSAQIKNLLL